MTVFSSGLLNRRGVIATVRSTRTASVVEGVRHGRGNRLESGWGKSPRGFDSRSFRHNYWEAIRMKLQLWQYVSLIGSILILCGTWTRSPFDFKFFVVSILYFIANIILFVFK
jgi:hypothetical protein